MQRRSLLQGLGLLSSGIVFHPSATLRNLERNYLESLETLDIFKNSEDPEDFWRAIRNAYSCSASIINLNNGGVSPQPRVVQEAVEYYNRMCNEIPSYYMWRILDQGREPLREKLALVAGCSPEEIAVNRNSSEALETIIFGLRLSKGDEVVLSKQDYPNMINAWKQRELRDGIKLVWVNLELPSEDDAYITETYTKAFTAKTKIVHITHMINWNGQLLPARRIADAAHQKGIEVVLDAAHSFAHIPYALPDLNVDYAGVSLHKWMSAPFGSGLLYVKKEKISRLYPLLAAADAESGDIRKFENLGTRSFAIEQGISHAVDFYHRIGAERKFKRLYELQNYWTSRVEDHPKIKINHPKHNSHSGALGNVSIEGMNSEDVSAKLFDQYKIHTVAINWENIHGVRITPNVYTTKEELDKLIKGLLKIANG